MVVVSDDVDTPDVERALYVMDRPGIRIAVDFVVTTPERYERLRRRHTLVCRRIAEEGREVCVAA